MSLFQAIVLGIVQGLTEFIPISSTAHLVFAARAVGLYDGFDAALKAQQTTATMAVIQLGTLLAVLIYFSRDITNITRAFVADHVALLTGRTPVSSGASVPSGGNIPSGRGPSGGRVPSGASDPSSVSIPSGGSIPSAGSAAGKLSHEAWLGWLVIIGSIPVGAVGLLFKKEIEGTFTKNLWIIATMMIVVALLLALAEWVGKRQRTMKQLGILDAIAVGCAQVLALVPGSSRSGSTIMGGLFAGETRETAARFSFLLSIPAIAASGLLELKEAVTKLPQESFAPLVVATLVSAIVGYASIWFLLRFLRTHSTGVFIVYRLIVGGFILFALSSGYISASVN
ncbi:MAG: undecaprenyl-diphosphate phosphatase [Pyrinomonadaceae bacterium]